jgi:hypothetical protein
MGTSVGDMTQHTNPPQAMRSGTNNNISSPFDLAKWIVILSFGVIGFLGLAAMLAGTFADEQKFSFVKDILSILLPVIGAWAGTVLAYYFSKQNYESAAQTANQLVDRLTAEKKLASTAALSVMIPLSGSHVLTLMAPENTYKLMSAILEGLDTHDRNRLPILDKNGRPKYMIHRSTLEQFLVRQFKEQSIQGNGNRAHVKDLTLQDALSDEKFQSTVVRGFGTIRLDDNLAKAKILIDNNPLCQDVFITEDGTPNTKALGWITNVLVMEQAKVE